MKTIVELKEYRRSNSMENTMDTAKRAQKPRAMYARARATLLSVSCAAMLAAPVQAYTLPVVEVGANLFNLTYTQVNTLYSQMESAAEYGTQAWRFTKTLANWAQKMARFQQIIASPLMPVTPTLKPVPIDFNVAEKCGTSSMFSFQGVMQALDIGSFSPQGDIRAQQRTICSMIQVIENQKYNETVKVLQESLPNMNQVLNKIAEIRALTSFEDEGPMNEVLSNTTLSIAKSNAAIDQWEQQMGLYDKHIDILTRQQRMLAERVLRGSKAPNILGTAVKTAALKAALSN
ncbi:hypothetical protein [Stenotrophomonas sp.]|jgi:hypothetical protein|uniref:hypothetical protein n=1 Tax=Stenotrophomonas sp. TaxID=69392 RepID=UPI0029ADFFA2|nr:hypothetical protein [Stenotrophomonas sp.]MDX3934400.1 hypothetical protein [Stenotrophomonas sp.]